MGVCVFTVLTIHYLVLDQHEIKNDKMRRKEKSLKDGMLIKVIKDVMVWQR